MRKLSFFLIIFFCFFLTGCLQSKEHLVIKEDGSGSLEVELMIPKGTVLLVDNALGSMMEGMSKAMGAKESSEHKIPKSIAEEMFGDKQQMLKKAQEKGVNIEFEYFKREKEEDRLYVKYKVRYDDIMKFLDSGILSTRIKLRKDKEGNLVCVLLSQSKQAGRSKMQLKQFEDWKQSENFKKMDEDMRKNILGALGSLQLETLITMPNQIKEVSGMFAQVDPKTAKISFSGNLLEDNELFNRIYALSTEPSQIVSSAKGVKFVPSLISSKEEQKQLFSAPVGSPVKVYLKNGEKIEGKLIEKSEGHVKVEFCGTILTYYNDKIYRIE